MGDTADNSTGAIDRATLVAVLRVTPIGVLVSHQGLTEYCNPAFLRMFGYDGHEDEIIGKPLLSMVAPGARAAIAERLARRRAGENVDASYDSAGVRRDGSEVPLHVAVQQVTVGGSQVILTFFVELTERLRTEDDLRKTNEKLAALVKASPVPTMSIDSAGIVRVWNPAAERVFGWTAEEAIGRYNPLVREDDKEEFERNLKTASTVGLRGITARRHRKDGSPVALEIYAAPVHDGTIAVNVDITERLRTEEALRRSQEQLQHAQKMEAVGRLAGMVAHDFNNLLTVLTGLTELLTLELGKAPQTAGVHLAEMQRALGRAAALTRQLLAFSRRQVLSPTVLDLNMVVKGMKAMLEALAGAAVTLETKLGADLGRVRADVGQLEQVIANLAVNAYDAMPRGGRLVLSTANVDLDDSLAAARFPVPAGKYVCLSVTDSGSGISETVLAHLFEPFFTTKERGKGTGLGLSTVLGIVGQSGGSVHVASQEGKGSTFSVYLPRVQEELTPEPPRSHRTPLPWHGAVVLVEDNTSLRRLARGILERAGYGVLEARDGAQALELVRATRGIPRLLLSDVLMPGLSGPELAEQVWAEAPEVPVVFMSGFADPETFPERVRARAAGFLPKPFDSAQLLRLVDDALRNATS